MPLPHTSHGYLTANTLDKPVTWTLGSTCATAYQGLHTYQLWCW